MVAMLLRILIRRVPPSPGEATSLELAFTELFIWFVKDYLLPNWNAQAAGPGVGWEKTLSAPALLTPELLTPGHPELKNPTGSVRASGPPSSTLTASVTPLASTTACASKAARAAALSSPALTARRNASARADGSSEC